MMRVATATSLPRINTEAACRPGEIVTSAGSSSQASSTISGSTLVEREVSGSLGTAHSIGAKYLRREPLSEEEKTLALCMLQSTYPQQIENASRLDKIDMLFSTCMNMEAHKKLKEELADAIRFTEIYNKTAHSWIKKFLLSKKQKASLQEEVIYAGQLCGYLHEVCGDVPCIRSEIDWLKKPHGELENTAEYQQLLVLEEEMVAALLDHAEHYIKSHIEYLEVSHCNIVKYIAQTQKFLDDPENSLPEPDIIDRAGMLLNTFPGVLGALITGAAYLLGATSVLIYIPIVIGILASGISIALYIVNALKFFPNERIKENRFEREKLNELFPKILTLLKEAMKMSTPVVGSFPSLLSQDQILAGLTVVNNTNKSTSAAIQEQLHELTSKKDAEIAALTQKVTSLEAKVDETNNLLRLLVDSKVLA